MDNIFIVLPLWATMLIVTGVVAGAAVGLQATIRRLLPEVLARRHNDVAGFLVAVVGVIYAVTVGFIIAQQWDEFTDAKDRSYREAFTLAAVAESSAVLGEREHRRYVEAVLDYNRAVLAGWEHQDRSDERAGLREAQSLDPLYRLLAEARPDTEAQRAFVQEAVGRLGQVADDREERLHRAGTAHLEWPLWVLVAFATVVVLVFCALFGLESPWLHYTMISGVALAVAGNLLLVILLNHPLSGPLRVEPDSYASVVRELSG
ncbi:MAG TPA: hypothetical protein VNV66_00425 [Pilimelia sp.]|nr:hypothetical protein [Pilimelia sp.]